jgi:hypothetical protein
MWAWLLSWFRPDLITRVQAETVKYCGFLPAVTTVSAIVSANNPQLASAVAIATAICSAVKTPMPAVTNLYGETQRPSGEVAGVPIEGEWIK